MTASSNLLAWLEPTAAVALRDTANARVLALALADFRRRQPLGLPLLVLEQSLAAVTLDIRGTESWEEKRIAASLVELLIKHYQLFRGLGFEHADEALLAYARKLTLTTT